MKPESITDGGGIRHETYSIKDYKKDKRYFKGINDEEF